MGTKGTRVKQQTKTGRWSVELGDEMRTPVRVAAAERGMTIADLIKAALKYFISRPVTRPS